MFFLVKKVPTLNHLLLVSEKKSINRVIKWADLIRVIQFMASKIRACTFFSLAKIVTAVAESRYVYMEVNCD